MTAPAHPTARHLLVIGGGIAGASAAYFAARSGWSVTVTDAAQGRASEVPCALLNLVRGPSGTVDARSQQGLALTWALIAELRARGHQVPHEQHGVLRPVASDDARRKVEAKLPADLPHRWLTPAESPVTLAPGWPHLLSLPQGGWVAGPALVTALMAQSGASVRHERAVAWDALQVHLEHGAVLHGDAVVWCGGSVGAGWANASGSGPGQMHGQTHGQTHRGGSLLLLGRRPAPLPVSAGVYLAPSGPAGGVLGATFEAPASQPNLGGPPLKSLRWLLERAAALSGDLLPEVTGLWSGSRLAGEQLGQQPGGWWALAGLGSKGFLLGPLLARQMIDELNTRAPHR